MLSSPTKEDLIQEQILQAAKQLFQVYGLRKVTMDDVAKAIGKGRSSLYYYYKSKEEILDAVIDMEIGSIMCDIGLAVEQALTSIEKLNAFFTTKLQYGRDRGGFFSTMDAGMDAEELSSYNKTKYAIHNRLFKLESDRLSPVIATGIDNGELRNMDAKEQAALVYLLLCTLHGLKREMAMNNDYSGISATVNTLTAMMMNGIKR